jgi:hypothetical protein
MKENVEEGGTRNTRDERMTTAFFIKRVLARLSALVLCDLPLEDHEAVHGTLLNNKDNNLLFHSESEHLQHTELEEHWKPCGELPYSILMQIRRLQPRSTSESTASHYLVVPNRQLSEYALPGGLLLFYLGPH